MPPRSGVGWSTLASTDPYYKSVRGIPRGYFAVDIPRDTISPYEEYADNNRRIRSQSCHDIMRQRVRS